MKKFILFLFLIHGVVFAAGARDSSHLRAKMSPKLQEAVRAAGKPTSLEIHLFPIQVVFETLTSAQGERKIRSAMQSAIEKGFHFYSKVLARRSTYLVDRSFLENVLATVEDVEGVLLIGAVKRYRFTQFKKTARAQKAPRKKRSSYEKRMKYTSIDRATYDRLDQILGDFDNQTDQFNTLLDYGTREFRKNSERLLRPERQNDLYGSAHGGKSIRYGGAVDPTILKHIEAVQGDIGARFKQKISFSQTCRFLLTLGLRKVE